MSRLVVILQEVRPPSAALCSHKDEARQIQEEVLCPMLSPEVAMYKKWTASAMPQSCPRPLLAGVDPLGGCLGVGSPIEHQVNQYVCVEQDDHR